MHLTLFLAGTERFGIWRGEGLLKPPPAISRPSFPEMAPGKNGSPAPGRDAIFSAAQIIWVEDTWRQVRTVGSQEQVVGRQRSRVALLVDGTSRTQLSNLPSVLLGLGFPQDDAFCFRHLCCTECSAAALQAFHGRASCLDVSYKPLHPYHDSPVLGP